MNTLKSLIICLIFTIFLGFQVKGQREEISLKNLSWKVWLDTSALWQNDRLYLPEEVNIETLPENSPTCGWKTLYADKGIGCNIPATVEEYFSKGDPLYTYHGVAWFWTTVDIPKNWKGKTINIHFTSTRLRCELYVNNKLSGYDIVAETPWQVDISKNLKTGEKNKIALRITNPGGFRGWEDFPGFKWGSYEFPASHDFGGIGGNIMLTSTNQKYIEDVFVENLLPAGSKKIKVNIILNKENQDTLPFSLNIGIVSHSTGKIIFSNDYFLKSCQDDSLKIELTVPEAELWNIDNPSLYECKINLKGNKINDNYNVLFGFRTFEVKEINNDNNFYFNGERIVNISSIDWGYYTGTGLYSSPLMAEKSVLAAKSIGHNGINCHRNIGDVELLKQANEKGLYIYEEPGGFHAGQQGYNVTDSTFAGKYMIEKCRRMAIRDRNSPCLIIHNLCNEDNYWTPLREKCMKLIHKLNPTVMVSNSSGGYIFDIFQMSPSNYINHIRPYENRITDKYEDNHTVEEYKGVFYEPFLFSHTYETKNLQYWGEVHCYGGPDNWYKSAEDLDQKAKWGANYYRPLHDKIFSFFKECNLSTTGSRVIISPEDVSVQAGRGLMYINGRAVQNLISRNNVDGFGINGWSGTTEVVPGEGGYWSSSILDASRNIKGVASDYAYWTKPLQICIKRINGAIFNPSDIAIFEITLVNQNKLASGNYLLKLKIKDGEGEYVPYDSEQVISVRGGDVFAQHICNLPVKLRNWKGGYITLEAKLYENKNKEVASGNEQILLNNRSSFNNQFVDYTGSVINWPEASIALKEAKVQISNFDKRIGIQSFICAGLQLPSVEIIDNLLKRVKEDGTILLLNFNEEWASLLYSKKIIAEIPKFGSAKIEGSWMGNGWGYLDYFIGNQAIPSKSTIGTNSWELGIQSLNQEQIGFYPLITTNPDCKTRAYGAYFARPDKLLILLGEIDYGKGRILLNSSYQIDQKHPLCDMIFFNMLTMDNQLRVKGNSLELPFKGEPVALPGILQMVDYNLGGEGIAYHDDDEINQGKEYRADGVDISSQNGNLFVGWINSGEWMEYNIDVKKSGTFSVAFEYATLGNSSSLLLMFDGINKGGEIKLPSTGDWFAFREYRVLLKLESGKQTLRVFFKGGGSNISRIKFEYKE
ncbi:MAG: carbohydrate-binding protein [Bacteroidales bacterium]|nr:carbohydrate-binding protein [Bacteroidales bacterium]